MAGMFNVFGVRKRLDFSNKEVSQIYSDKYVGSSSYLYGSSSPCLPKKTVEKCRQIHERMLKMLNRVSAGQLKTKTNIDRIDMGPGIWGVLSLYMHRKSFLNTPSHTV
jgi:hypothetical protein